MLHVLETEYISCIPCCHFSHVASIQLLLNRLTKLLRHTTLRRLAGLQHKQASNFIIWYLYCTTNYRMKKTLEDSTTMTEILKTTMTTMYNVCIYAKYVDIKLRIYFATKIQIRSCCIKKTTNKNQLQNEVQDLQPTI